ncbi:GNAT family N-acetyltransferase [candidate division KSB1 bacterium]|nr:GNAT family N-acetyltransferase [candidate division KSB1 bacterium]
MKSTKFLEINSNPHESDLAMAGIRIRKCYLSDIESIRYLQPQGWDDITYYFQFYCAHSFCHPIVALAKEQIVGVAAGILNIKTGWLAHIIVSETHRGKGIGRQLTQHIIDFLHQQGCETLLLIATEMGEPVYRKCGFTIVTEYQFYKGNQIQIDSVSGNIRNLLPSDLAQIFEMDAAITGEKRQHMLENFLSNGWIYRTDSKIRGFFLPEFSEGTIIASDDNAGIELLKFKLSLRNSKAVLPEENESGIQLLESYGFEKYNRAKRMALGETIQWKPELIYSRAGGFYG